MKEKLRHLWHELYYKLAPESGVEFGMTCRDVTALIDLKKRPVRPIDRFRMALHLSLCQACNYYLKASTALGKAIRSMMKQKENSVDLIALNQDLLKQYGSVE